MRKVVITGGLGFIGSNLVKYWFNKYNDRIIVLDSETYAAKPEYLQKYFRAVAVANPAKIVKAPVLRDDTDIRNSAQVEDFFRKEQPDIVIHLAAESHVCNSINGPRKFMETNIMGTFNILEAMRKHCPQARFHHVSTDEVFGELSAFDQPFTELSPVVPRSPYATSKAASDMIAICYHTTYGMNVTVSNCSNNFGPNQHEEKLIPRTVRKILKGEDVTIYGSGEQVRDWLHVEDHCEAISRIIFHGKAGERYCIGGEKELTNIGMVHRIYQVVQRLKPGAELNIKFTNDRPTDDFRYAINNTKIRSLGFIPSQNFDELLEQTISSIVEEL